MFPFHYHYYYYYYYYSYYAIIIIIIIITVVVVVVVVVVVIIITMSVIIWYYVLKNYVLVCSLLFCFVKFFGHNLEEIPRRNILKFNNLKPIFRARRCRYVHNPTTKFHVPRYKQEILNFFFLCLFILSKITYPVYRIN